MLKLILAQPIYHYKLIDAHSALVYGGKINRHY